MPIRPENRHYYTGEAWQRLRKRILARANNACEVCNVQNGQTYFRFLRGICHEARVVLTVAHLNHNPADNRLKNLQALCQRCHLKHDEKHHAKSRRETRLKKQGLQELFEKQ
jgi:5-methylcytosine-specific restriction endonuclease McrA